MGTHPPPLTQGRDYCGRHPSVVSGTSGGEDVFVPPTPHPPHPLRVSPNTGRLDKAPLSRERTEGPSVGLGSPI